MIEAYGFDSYNQYCWPEIEPTIRSFGGGDGVPKCFVRKKHETVHGSQLQQRRSIEEQDSICQRRRKEEKA